MTESEEIIPRFAVPEGFVLVPKVPTKEMMLAAYKATGVFVVPKNDSLHSSYKDAENYFLDNYQEMISAAPKINIECEHVAYATNDRRMLIFKDSPNMLPEDVTGLTKLVALTVGVVPEPQYKAMPREMTDEIGQAIALQARCCGGIALSIYEAALNAEPEGDDNDQ